MGAFKLGKMTFGSLFKQPETVKYPLERKPQPAGLKGHIVIDVDRCILCGMCERGCTTDCITVDKKERFWEIQPYQCIQCGYCITVCPKDCLAMDPDYTPASLEMGAKRHEVPSQPKNAQATAKDVGRKPANTAPADATAASKESAERDAQVDALIDLMDPEKAAKARLALS